ncbi:MAG: 6-phosphofructokinase [Clostridiaceae bacterium]|nr:6-phosphofructokinase [Clostridiaceae bacterium]
MNFLQGNCLVAQSGGPTAVINSSAYGVIKEFMENRKDEKIFVGLNGIEGILNNKIYDVDKLSMAELNIMKYLPSSSLGSCRYKLKNPEDSIEEYEKIFNLFETNNIKYFFYIGGNDSMDAAKKLCDYAKDIKSDIKIIGVPKTIDNDLVETDHCPGFGSTAKYVCNTGIELWLDTRTYYTNSIMVMEVMGRDAGWIAASSGLIKEAIPDINQLIYLPEVPFRAEKFLQDVKSAVAENGKLLVVTSEGLKNSEGDYINVDSNCYENDQFGHKQLGGIGKYLQTLIKDNVEKRVKLAELGVSQRCAMHCVSKTDLDEAELVGRVAVKYAIQGKTGFMVALDQVKDKENYECITRLVELNLVCNAVKGVPKDFINSDGCSISKKMIDYVSPLIIGEINSFGNNGLLKHVDIRKSLGHIEGRHQ